MHTFCVNLWGFIGKCCCRFRNKQNKVAPFEERNEKQIVDMLFDDDSKIKRNIGQKVVDCLYPLSKIRLDHETNRYYMNISNADMKGIQLKFGALREAAKSLISSRDIRSQEEHEAAATGIENERVSNEDTESAGLGDTQAQVNARQKTSLDNTKQSPPSDNFLTSKGGKAETTLTQMSQDVTKIKDDAANAAKETTCREMRDEIQHIKSAVQRLQVEMDNLKQIKTDKTESRRDRHKEKKDFMHHIDDKLNELLARLPPSENIPVLLQENTEHESKEVTADDAQGREPKTHHEEGRKKKRRESKDKHDKAEKDNSQ